MIAARRNRCRDSFARRAAALPARLLISVVPAPAQAQVTTTGSVRVAVTDQAGLPVPGADARFTSPRQVFFGARLGLGRGGA